MSVFEFLSSLNSLNIKVWIEDDQLRYRAPKGVMTSALKQELIERKAEIISCLQEAKTAKKLAFEPILPVDRDGNLPLSFSQQRMWFLNQIDSQNPSYNESFQFKIVGALNVAVLEQSINEIIRRHEALRTIFPTVDGLAVQQIVPSLTITIPVVDLQGLEETEIQQRVTQEVREPFDLAISPLLRASLLRLESELHLLILTLHHIIVDGWSMGILIKELSAIYQAFSTGSPTPLPELTIQYADFAVWQRKWLTEELQQKQLDYWKQQLANAAPLLELPTDYPRSSVQNFSGAIQNWKLNSHLTAQIKTLSQQSGTTLFVTLLAAFAVLLHRYSGQTDICIGSPFANRNRTEVESLIGCFINTLVLRTQIKDNPRFQELLAQVNSVVLDAQAHQNVPFEQVVEALQPERSLSYNPLFQVMFVLENFSLETLELPGISLTPEMVERGTAQFDLSLSIWETQDELIGSWEYNSDLFEADTIARMTGHFQTLLEAIVSARHLKIGEFPLLTSSERHQLLVEWNDTQADYPLDQCIHQLFEEQVARTPDAVAVMYENQQLTYHELNCRANQLAHYLRSLGVGADVLVGLCVERSLLMVIGLLGILKAGGAYVPLDPEYPTERLSFMVEDAQVKVLLTQQALLERLADNQRQFICLDTDWQIISQSSDLNLVNTTIPENLAYVIYTSGSTGKPKGVMVEHQSFVNLIAATKLIFAINSSDRLLQFSSISFDSAVEEIWHCLSCGGTLVLRTDEILNSVSTFLQKCQEWKLTVLELPTAYWHQLTSELAMTNQVLPTSVRLVIIGGEQVLLEKLKLWQKYIDDKLVCGKLKQRPLLLNAYGPSEATVEVTLCKLSELVLEDTQTRLPIGRPINNVQIYILDSELQPMPIGMAGELYIGGICLARGYWNARELTAEKFISNPFSPDPNSRLYKTGDLARYLPDGNIEYLGRIDNQVKIRGFRIELGEIEAVLSQHPQIQTSVVIVRVDNSREKRLVAYLVSNSEVTPTTNELREYLKAKLPEYMIPSAIVFLETLPLTPNGKIDQRALPAPDFNTAPIENYVAPRTPIEEILCHLFSQVLKLNQVGINDNFFEIGGHSLLATQLISRIRTHLQVELPLRSLFSAPTVAELAAHIQAIKQQNLQLKFPPIVKRENQSELPLSYAQTRLWFIDQLQPNSALYNIPLALRIAGRLQIATLEKSLSKIVQRHEILRTNFITINGQVNQIIHAENHEFLSIVDFQHLAPDEQEIAVQELIQQQTIQPFNLAKDSLIRITLVKLGETEHILMICMHHIISDGWSIGVLVQELAALYNADTQNQPSLRDATRTPLTSLPIQYADFAIWQREWLQGEVLQTQLNYWKQQLADAPALLSLPTDRPRPAVQTYTGAHQKFVLSSELTEKLTQLSQEQGVTLFMTLLAGFNTLLYRYTQQEDIVVGSPIANRNHSEIEGLIGFFVNPLVLRTDLSKNPSFTELIHRVKEVSLAAYAHQDLPFEMLVEAVAPSRDLSYSPLFQVMFVLQNAPMSQLELSGLTLSPQELEMPIAKFDLTLSMENTATGLEGVWEYNTDLFDSSTIERMTGHFLTLLEAIVVDPQTAISQLPILTAAEQQQLLVEWNDTQTDYPVDKCIHQLFEQQVEKTPDAVAVVFEHKQLTYRELNSRANQLAHYLRSLGVGADVLVGICVERSLEMVVGLLGILKAGGAYLPLDPEYPVERLQFILEDTQVKVLLTQQWLLAQLPQHQAEIVCLDDDWSIISQSSSGNLIASVKPSHLAYVIYTSGSTGQPKGVLIEHTGLVNLVFWHQRTFSITSTDKTTQLASTAFDAAVWELWPYLTTGASVYLLKPEILLSPVDLQAWLNSKEITISFVPTPVAEQLLSIEWTKTTTLRTLLTGGDQLDQHPSGSIPFAVFNNYGPTENTVVTTSGRVVSEQQADAVSPPIGHPIANTQVYILDEYLQPVPVGVPGELHIGGVGLAKGYLNRPELTAEKFIPHPFDKSERLYKTGDLARYLSDGNIEYLGRIDHQVKIRGFRIELGEIEAVLSQHPQIQKSVVIARVDNPGEKRLVAYVVFDSDVKPTTNELREYLKAKLPEYMIPSAIVFLETLPLTPNGKIDRRALPKPELDSTILEKYVAARTPIEEMLAQIWAQVLKVELVGIQDNFFELGGHSLLATQLISRIRNLFQVELPLRELFVSATVSHLAQVIRQLQQQDLELSTAPILPRVNNTDLPLSFTQQRLWFLDQFAPNSPFYNIPLALRLVGNLNQVALEQSLQEIIARHEALRTNFIAVDGQPFQIVQPQTNWTVSVVDLKHLSTTEQEVATQQLAQQQAIEPFDLARQALIRATLLVLNETEYVLSVCIHHIVSDGWSMGVFSRELADLYNAYSTGQPSPLAPLSIQYADFAIWQRQWLQGDVLQTQLSYWQKQLADAPGLLSLPTDRPRPTVQTYRGAYQEFALSQKLSVALQQLSQKESATLFMTLLAAFQILLWRYSGQDDICVGTPIANRNRAEIEGVIGFFVNTLVLRTDLGENPSFRQLLSQVREVALGAYAHQDLPFELLVEKLQLQRDLSHNPIFQVWFNVLNLGDDQLQLSGLSVEPISIPDEVSKFDLSLYVQEQKQGIKLELVYNSDLFNSDTIATMLLHYQNLLESIVANPEQKISTLPLLTETEYYSLKNRSNLVKPSNFFTEFCQQDIEQSIPARFEEQVRKYPDHIAVHTNHYHWTYSELNCRANQIAQAILKQYTLREERIALLFEHDAPMIAVILGVLKIGKTYVPLDPNYPTERLVYILKNSEASAVITNNKNLGRAQELIKGSIPIVNIDEISFTSSDHPINLKISPDTIAYILYTSGSTGQPKGVIQNHRNVLHFIRNYTNRLHVNEQDGLTLLSSYSFDAAIVDIFTTLLNGATLYPINIKEEGLTHLFQVLQQQNITIYHSTPTLYRHFIKSLSQDEKLNQIRLVVLGGEEVVRTDVDSYKEHFDDECIFVNCIGSTESSITMLYLLNQQTEITRNTVPIGYPVEETEILLLNQFGEKTDIYGEIAIRSPYIALGYWQKPDLTQAVFLPDPELSSKRIYRTGDLGRLRPDGSLEFLGRKDFQVKIRGFRVELGEIEAAIAQHPSVGETVVIAKEDESGDKHLVAYIVATQTLTTNEIRPVLKQKLPDYMIPSSFVFLDSLPLTPNGKVNRRALPAPSFKSSSDKFVAPRNPLELQLVQIWSKILKVDKVGVQDNFFDLGGHSLLVPYLIAQIKQQFGKDLPLITLFQNPTIEQLASIVQQDSVQNDSSSGSVLVAIQANGSKQPFFCIPGAGAYPFYLYNLASYLDQDQPFYSFQADGLDGKLEPIIGIENIAARYIQALKAVQSQGPYFLGGHSFGGKVAFEIAQQLLRQGHIVALVAIFDTPAPFNRQKPVVADWDHAKWLSEFAKIMEFEFAKNLGISEDALKSLLPEEQLKYVLERLKMVNILPSNAQPTELNNLLQVLKANALVDYLPQQVYPTPITLFRAKEVSSEELKSKFPSEILEDMTWGWNKFSVEQVNVHFVPGDHLTMMAKPHVQVLAERLKACIEKARATIL